MRYCPNAAPASAAFYAHRPCVMWSLTLGAMLLLMWHFALVCWSGAGLHVDEAQYWDWAEHLAWGYYSKPPGIAFLIHLSTRLLGDSVLGIRALAMLCWVFTGLVLAALGRSMQGERAGVWAGVLFLAAPAAGLLGLTATTDAPLMLCWALWMMACWRLLRAPQRWQNWLLAGVVLGLGLLSKYTMVMAVPSLGLLLWRRWRLDAHFGTQLRPVAGGFLLMLGVAALLCAPHLAWNQAQGWPTLQHTAQITVQASARQGQSVWQSVLEFAAGQLLLWGPASWWVLWSTWRRRHTVPVCPLEAAQVARQQTAQHFAHAFTWPLLGLGLLQAWHARAGLNWAAPAMLGVCLGLGLWAGAQRLPSKPMLLAALAGVALSSSVALLGLLAPMGAQHRPPAWDVWARMRGWEGALNALRPALRQHPHLPVLAGSRDVIVHATYAWRDLGLHPQAWPAAPGQLPAHHYEMISSLPQPTSAQAPAELLWLGRTPPTGAWVAGYAHISPIAQAQDGRVRLGLWWLRR